MQQSYDLLVRRGRRHDSHRLGPLAAQEVDPLAALSAFPNERLDPIAGKRRVAGIIDDLLADYRELRPARPIDTSLLVEARGTGRSASVEALTV